MLLEGWSIKLVFQNYALSCSFYRKSKRLRNIVTLLRAKYINNGHWVVSTQEKIHFVKLCGEGSKTIATDIIVRPPIKTFTLEQSCYAVTSAMTLPPHYHQESN